MPLPPSRSNFKQWRLKCYLHVIEHLLLHAPLHLLTQLLCIPAMKVSMVKWKGFTSGVAPQIVPVEVFGLGVQRT
jgi:hypothetical protein